MNTLSEVIDQLPGLDGAMGDAADWLAERALIDTVELEEVENRVGHCYTDWRGAFRGEYSMKQRVWWLFCPMWHGAQAVKALLWAGKVRSAPAPSWARAARMGGEFLMRHRVTSGPDAGLLLAYEDHGDKVTTSAMLESLDALFLLSDHTGESQYQDAALAALGWCRQMAWLRGEGLVQDLFDPATRKFLHHVYPSLKDRLGRPLVDDAVWLTAFQRSGDGSFRGIFYEILERLLRDEAPKGNWASYGPCVIEDGCIHPRHAYWWGRPLLAAWNDTHEQRWLDAACRAGDWYRRAQRSDGGLFRETTLTFNTSSFGQATSGILCAAILWIELYEATRDPIWLEPIQLAFQFGMRMQLTDVSDPRLRGAIIEGTTQPDGTDRCPYFIRDLASIFFVQAAAMLLRHRKSVTVTTMPNIRANKEWRKKRPLEKT